MRNPDNRLELTSFIESTLSTQKTYDPRALYPLWFGGFARKAAQTIFTPHQPRYVKGQLCFFPSTNPDDFFKKPATQLEDAAFLITSKAGGTIGEAARDLHILGIFLGSLGKVSRRGPSDSAEPDFVLRERITLLFANFEESDSVKWKSKFDKVSDTFATRLVMAGPQSFYEASWLLSESISERNMALSEASLAGPNYQLTPQTLERNAGLSSLNYLMTIFHRAVTTPVRQ
jgi:hypothetical protein